MKFNKILLVIASFLTLAISSLGQNNIGTLVTDPIRPFSVSSTHPSAIANEIKGGPFTSSNLAGLSNIPAPRLELGAIGYATNTGLYYRLTATNPATWSSIDGINITNLNASNITGSIPFLNISNALTNANVAFGNASFNNQASFSSGTVSIPSVRLGPTNLNFGIFQGNLIGFGNWLGVVADGLNIARFQSNRVYFDQPIAFASSTSSAALTTRTNLGIQDFVTNPVVQVASGGTGATNAGGARTNLGLGATNDVAFQNLFLDSGQLSISNSGIYWLGTVRYEPENQTFQGTIQIENGAVAIVGTNAAANIATTRTNLGLGGANSVVFSNLSLSNGAQTNLALAIGSTNRGFFATAGPERIGVVVGGSNVASFYSGSFEVNSQFSVGAGATVTGNFSVGGPISFIGASSNIAITRTNLGLGWTALTNTNVGTGLVSVDTNGEVVSPTNFWQRAPIQTTVQDFTGITVNQTNNATNARNVYVYSLATNVSGISNTIILPTNTLTLNGDEVTVVHKGTTNTTTVVRQAGATNNLITLNKFDESVKFIRELGQWDFYHNISFVEPIQFSGTNAAANAAASRTNLGLGATNDVQFNTVNARGIFDGTNEIIDIENNWLNYVGFGATFEWNDTANTTYVPFAFGGTNSALNAATTRTNLGIPLAALTNTSTTNFQKAIFYTNTAPSNIGGNLGSIAAWIEIVASNGVTYKVPAYTNVP